VSCTWILIWLTLGWRLIPHLLRNPCRVRIVLIVCFLVLERERVFGVVDLEWRWGWRKMDWVEFMDAWAFSRPVLRLARQGEWRYQIRHRICRPPIRIGILTHPSIHPIYLFYKNEFIYVFRFMVQDLLHVTEWHFKSAWE